MIENERFYVEKSLYVFFEFYQCNDYLKAKNLFNILCPSELLSITDYQLFLLFGFINPNDIDAKKFMKDMFLQILDFSMELLEKLNISVENLNKRDKQRLGLYVKNPSLIS